MLYYNNTKFILNIEDSKIENAGKGVFTYEFIPKNTFIGYYIGEIKKMSHECVGDYSFSLSEKYYIDANKDVRCYIAMINDSHNSKYKNNCEFRITKTENGKKLKPKQRKISLWSIKDISKYSELYASYGDEYWNDR
jgi:hypothetical protein